MIIGELLVFASMLIYRIDRRWSQLKYLDDGQLSCGLPAPIRQKDKEQSARKQKRNQGAALYLAS